MERKEHQENVETRPVTEKRVVTIDNEALRQG